MTEIAKRQWIGLGLAYLLLLLVPIGFTYYVLHRVPAIVYREGLLFGSSVLQVTIPLAAVGMVTLSVVWLGLSRRFLLLLPGILIALVACMSLLSFIPDQVLEQEIGLCPAECL